MQSAKISWKSILHLTILMVQLISWQRTPWKLVGQFHSYKKLKTFQNYRTKITFFPFCLTMKISICKLPVPLTLLDDTIYMCMVGKNVQTWMLLPGKFDHLVGNCEFFNKEIHKKLCEMWLSSWEICILSRPVQVLHNHCACPIFMNLLQTSKDK